MQANEPAIHHPVDAYNVVWTSPSEDMFGSMPIGNGDLAANVWMEPHGDLVFYISKSDAWSAEQELLKLGRVRIRLDQPFCREGDDFRQELDLRRGRIVFSSGPRSIVFWIDAHHDTIHIEMDANEPFDAEVALESWRTPDGNRSGGAAPDTFLPTDENTIRWFQRNTRSIFADTLRNQHLGAFVDAYHDPLMDLTFGGMIEAAGLTAKNERTLATTSSVKTLHVSMHALTAQTETPEAWVEQLELQRAATTSLPLEERRTNHQTWWSDFWSRSHIFATGTPEAESVTRAYVLQRWIQAGAGRGTYPIKFNGSLFTVDGLIKNANTGQIDDHGPDWRQWGGCYWFQNTREPYWAMLYAGDVDHMQALWNMYRNAIPLLKDRTRAYFGHGGIFCSETIYPWGLNRNGDFGIGNTNVYPQNPYIRYYWDSGLELSMMMLDTFAHTGDETFARDTLLPIAEEVIIFYDEHYPRTDDGKVLFSPAMSLETWHTAEDPLPVIAGLHTVMTRLLEIPEALTTDEQRERWQRLLNELPDLPFGEENGKKWIKPARTYADRKNSENPELYAVFPFRMHTLGKPDLDLAIETWHRRLIKRTGGWSQDAIQAALLGLTDEAKAYVVQNATDKSIIGEPVRESRFPAFWGPNFDWLPDQCQGSVTMIALQRMLMQCEDDTIRLIPAWPKDWNADFKLHAPRNTIVEGRVENGKIVTLNVTPEARSNDVIVMELPEKRN